MKAFTFELHISFILQTLMEDEPEKYQTHFSQYIKKGVEPECIEELYKKVHAAIRADPCPKKTQKEPPKEHKRYCKIIAYSYLVHMYTANLSTSMSLGHIYPTVLSSQDYICSCFRLCICDYY